MTSKYLIRFERMIGPSPHKRAGLVRLRDEAPGPDPVGRAWVERMIALHTEAGTPVLAPLALDAEIGEAAACLCRPCWLVAPFEVDVTAEGVELLVADPFDVAGYVAGQVATRALPRVATLALMNLVRAEDAPGLVRDLCPHVMMVLDEAGALAVRVREEDVSQTVRALGGRAAVHLLGDHTAGLVITRSGPGPRPVNDNHFDKPPKVSAAAAVTPATVGSPDRLTAYSCFAGGGGLDIGFAQEGFEIVGANEVQETIADVYEANLGGKVHRGSIVDLSSRDVGSPTIIFGGPPCQSFSRGGNRLGTADSRGRLIFDFLNLVCECAPLAFVMENVPALATDHEAAFREVLEMAERGGYVTSHAVLLASDYGVPQNRRRLFLVGYHRSLGVAFDFAAVKKVYPRPTLIDAIGDLKWQAMPWDGRREGLTGHEYLADGFGPQFMASNRVRGWLEQSNTAVANYRSVPLHPMAYPPRFACWRDFMVNRTTGTAHRRVTPREVARIQTFPDWYDPCVRGLPTAYKLLGNAVPPRLAQAIAAVIRNDLERVLRVPQVGSAA